MAEDDPPEDNPQDGADPDGSPQHRRELEEAGYFFRVGMREMLSAVIASNLEVSAKLSALIESHIEIYSMLGDDPKAVEHEITAAAARHHEELVRRLLADYGRLPQSVVEILQDPEGRRGPGRDPES